MLKIIITAAVTTLLALADGPVLKTGQVKSYNANGDIVTDGSIKDDGYYRTGKAASYTSGYDVVSDLATGLRWQDDESIAKTWVTKANYDAGKYFDTSGDTATTYCNTLTLFGGGWRLPTIQELHTLVDYGQHEPSTTPDVFQNIHGHPNYSEYWSSTTSAGNDSHANTVHFYGGNVGGNQKLTYGDRYVRCVRDGQLAPSNLGRDPRTKIVTDWTTGLQWQDDEGVGAVRMTWETAINYCENILTLGGNYDWRMPNNNELFSIIDYSRWEPAINILVFINIHTSQEWSSTTVDSNTENAWLAYFKGGLLLPLGRKVNVAGYVRCVRGGEGGSGGFIPPIISYLLN